MHHIRPGSVLCIAKDISAVACHLSRQCVLYRLHLQRWLLPVSIIRSLCWLLPGLGLIAVPLSWKVSFANNVEWAHELLLVAILEQVRSYLCSVFVCLCPAPIFQRASMVGVLLVKILMPLTTHFP